MAYLFWPERNLRQSLLFLGDPFSSAIPLIWPEVYGPLSDVRINETPL